MSRRLALAAAAFLGGVAAVACGGAGEAPPATGTAAPATAVVASATPAASPSPSATAAPGQPARGGRMATLNVAGLQRSYRIYVPSSLQAEQPSALVFVIHGAGGEPVSFAAYSGFDAVAEGGGFLAVYPAGLNGTFNAGGCCAGASYDDVGFILALADALSEEFRVDPGRVYATGHSNGGMMSFRLACEAADRFAAVASVAGTLAVPDCSPSRPVAALAIHGDADIVVPYAGGVGYMGLTFRPVPAAMAVFAAANGCRPEPTRSTEGRITTSNWGGCARGGAVSIKVIAGGSHAWPRRPLSGASANDPDQALDAAREVWAFFESNARP